MYGQLFVYMSGFKMAEEKMAESQISLNWHTYFDNMRTGFSLSQQNGDFVDLTLAADGHLVKVHQLIVGIASPYIKSLIKSAPCQHPVIFLNNVSYQTLCSLLEYIYTGEVAIPEENLEMFLSVAKTLRIQGLDDMEIAIENINESDVVAKHDNVPESETEIKINIISDRIITPNLESTSLETIDAGDSKERKVVIGSKRKTPAYTMDISLPETSKNSQQLESSQNSSDVSIISDSNNESVIIGNAENKFELAPVADMSIDNYANSQVQYTVSSRGSLQLILNRYMYNLFSRSNKGQIRRWRCVDYRDRKCPACCITNGNVVIRRTNIHIHPFHDKKILAKIQKKAIYSAIKAMSSKEESEM